MKHNRNDNLAKQGSRNSSPQVVAEKSGNKWQACYHERTSWSPKEQAIEELKKAQANGDTECAHGRPTASVDDTKNL